VYVFDDSNLGNTNQSAADVVFTQKLDYRMHGGMYYGQGGINCTSLCEGDLFGSNVTLDESSNTLRLFVTAPTESSSAWNLFDNPQPNGSVGYYSGAVFVFGQ
jgi:hypothetical protein